MAKDKRLLELYRTKNPFSLGELDELMNRRIGNDIDYLKKWIDRAIQWYELESQILHDIVEAIEYEREE